MTSFELREIEVNGERLHGLISAGNSGAPVAIHLHGTGGNFYENAIATRFASIYEAHGYRFASVNLPGHDGGSVNEKFDLSFEAISAWAESLASGVPILWQAHSLGALKILKFLTESGSSAAVSRSERLVLLAPFDLRAFYAQNGDSSVINAKAANADREVAAGRGAQVVPEGEFAVWPISWTTYADALRDKGTLDVFPTATGSVGALADLTVPRIVLVGGDDFSASPSPQAVVDLASKVANTSAFLIPDAPHNFAGFEDEVEQKLTAFLS